MELADSAHAVGDAAFVEHRPGLVHDTDVVVAFGPVHADKEHLSSSLVASQSLEESAAP